MRRRWLSGWLSVSNARRGDDCLDNCSSVVFQVLPIGYRQKLKRNMYLANPQSVNFDRYVRQLQEAVELYERSVLNVLSVECNEYW